MVGERLADWRNSASVCVCGSCRDLRMWVRARFCSSRNGMAKLSLSGGVHMTRVACKGKGRVKGAHGNLLTWPQYLPVVVEEGDQAEESPPNTATAQKTQLNTAQTTQLTLQPGIV